MIGLIRNAAVILVAVSVVAACAERTAETNDTTAADTAAIRALLDHVEQTFGSGDLDAAMAVFADDAMILGQGLPDIVGHPAIRALYADMMSQFDIDADLTSDEIRVAGDLAYERGTYTLRLTDKSSGRVVSDVENRHIHILKRQPDGGWKTWRMMVNSVEPSAQ